MFSLKIRVSSGIWPGDSAPWLCSRNFYVNIHMKPAPLINLPQLAGSLYAFAIKWNDNLFLNYRSIERKKL